MTNRQIRFADEYCIDLNAIRAYKTAYPKVKSDDVARKAASRLLTKVDVKGYVEQRLNELKTEKTADAQEVMEYLSAVLRGQTSAEIVVIEGCGEGCSSARRMMKSPDEKERLKAAELLGKRFNLFTDKLNISGGAKVVIVDDLDESE